MAIDQHRPPETSWLGIILTAGTLVLCPWLGRAKQRIGEKLGSRATFGEGTQNVLCAILAGAVLVGLAANTLFGLWWLPHPRLRIFGRRRVAREVAPLVRSGGKWLSSA